MSRSFLFIPDPRRADKIGFESSKAFEARCHSNFWTQFVPGPAVLDIGYRGGRHNALPIFDAAIGVELDYPGYDGLHLPFGDASQDAVHSSHVLEHVPDDAATLREWWRVLRVGGNLILFVPSAYLYERRLTVPPSRWSGEHLRCYTPATLLATVERTLAPNSYRVRHLADCDLHYDYALSPDQHPVGCLEIELVLQKLDPPAWSVEP